MGELLPSSPGCRVGLLATSYSFRTAPTKGLGAYPCSYDNLWGLRAGSVYIYQYGGEVPRAICFLGAGACTYRLDSIPVYEREW